MYKLSFFVLVIAALASCSPQEVKQIDLSGTWGFKIDSTDRGETEAWYNIKFDEVVTLPGSMVENGKGNNITMSTKWIGGINNPNWHNDPNYASYHDSSNIRFPFWLQPDKKYTGAAWYQRMVTIPKSWKDKTIELNLERCHWETTVWLDEQKLGMENSLATPHIYKITDLPPGKHRFSIRVDNRIKEIDPGINSHSISDHTQSNWNGIVGNISLTAREKISIENLKIVPDVKNKSVHVIANIKNGLGQEKTVNLNLHAQGINVENPGQPESLTKEILLSKGNNEIALKYNLGSDALLWDEFTPNLHQLNLSLAYDDKVVQTSEIFGLREITIDEGLIKMNGRRIFFRGTLECAIFPKTGYPPTNKEEWNRICKVIKSHGLNHIRFHSWCPPEAAFDAADEEGVYLQVECSSWANQSTTLGDGKPIDNFIWEESKRIVEAYGNHPSFCLMAYGNEPGGPKYREFLTEFVNYWKVQDNRRLYTTAAGWPAIPENNYHNIPEPRIQGWGEQLKSVINAEPPKTDYDWHSRNRMPTDGIPVISHEIGQWCVYPNFKEIEKYTGVLKAKNFEIFKESLEANKMGHLADSFLLASGKLQALCYKADIEAALRTKGFGGFQLLDLHDFPGQGTALVGILDPFWEEKGYIKPEEFKRFCNTVVPLARLEKRVFLEGETLTAQVEVANFGVEAILIAQPNWQIKDSQNNIVGEGTFEKRNIEIGNGIVVGNISYQIPKIDLPEKLVLEVNISGYSNSWDIWVYPKKSDAMDNGDVLFATKMDSKTIKALKEGKNVLLSLGNGKVKEGIGGEAGLGFSSIFWNTAWTNGQKPYTLGILCNPDHPALELFPTEYHSNWQWWDAMSHADVIKLNDFSEELKPIVRVIDDWVTNRRLALLFEAKVGNGKLLVSGADLHSNLENRPEARQLLSSLNNYMTGNNFNPKVEISIEKVQGILK